MAAANNIQLVQNIYAAFGRGDLPAILEHVADDVKWGVHANSKGSKNVPWHEHLVGKANVPKFFAALASQVEFTRFEPQAFAASEDTVYATVSYDAIYKPTTVKLTGLIGLHRFTFKNGRISEWIGTEDTARILEAVTGK